MQESSAICQICSTEVSKKQNFMVLECQHTFHVTCFVSQNISKCPHCQKSICHSPSFRTPSPRRRPHRPPSIYEERRHRQEEISLQQNELRRQLYTELRISEN